MNKEELYNVLKIKDSMIDELIKKLDNKENIIKEVRERASYEETNVESLSNDILSIIDKGE